MLLSKDQIIGASDRTYRDVEVSEWGGVVRLWTLQSAERDSFEASLLDHDGERDLSNLRARLVAKCIGDEDGKRLFSEGDVIALGKKSASVLGRLFNECRDLNGFDESVEAAEGN